MEGDARKKAAVVSRGLRAVSLEESAKKNTLIRAASEEQPALFRNALLESFEEDDSMSPLTPSQISRRKNALQDQFRCAASGEHCTLDQQPDEAAMPNPDLEAAVKAAAAKDAVAREAAAKEAANRAQEARTVSPQPEPSTAPGIPMMAPSPETAAQGRWTDEANSKWNTVDDAAAIKRPESTAAPWAKRWAQRDKRGKSLDPKEVEPVTPTSPSRHQTGQGFRRALHDSFEEDDSMSPLSPSQISRRKNALQDQFRCAVQTKSNETVAAAWLVCRVIFRYSEAACARWLHCLRRAILEDRVAGERQRLQCDRFIYGWRRYCNEALVEKERKQLQHMTKSIQTREKMASDLMAMMGEQVATGRKQGAADAQEAIAEGEKERDRLREQLHNMNEELCAAQTAAIEAERAAKKDRVAVRSKERELRAVQALQANTIAKLEAKEANIATLEQELKNKDETTNHLLAMLATQKAEFEAKLSQDQGNIEI